MKTFKLQLVRGYEIKNKKGGNMNKEAIALEALIKARDALTLADRKGVKVYVTLVQVEQAIKILEAK